MQSNMLQDVVFKSLLKLLVMMVLGFALAKHIKVLANHSVDVVYFCQSHAY